MNEWTGIIDVLEKTVPRRGPGIADTWVAKEARPFRFVPAEPPEPDFLRLAHATRWITASGKEIASAAVDVFVHGPEADRLLPRAEDPTPFRLTRTLPLPLERHAERFYPEGFAEYG